jgi:hypothetical protein
MPNWTRFCEKSLFQTSFRETGLENYFILNLILKFTKPVILSNQVSTDSSDMNGILKNKIVYQFFSILFSENWILISVVV